MFSVFQDISQLCVARSVTAGFSETQLNVVIAVFICLYRRQPQRCFQFTRGAGLIFGAGADNGGQGGTGLLQDHITTRLKNGFGNGIKVAAQTGHLQQKVLRHFDVNLCHW